MKDNVACSCEDDEVKEKKLAIGYLIVGSLCLITAFVLTKFDKSFTDISYADFSNPAFFSSYSFIAFIIYTLGYLVLFTSLLTNYLKEAKEKHFINEFLLMIVATLGAYGLNEYPEALFVILFSIVGEMLEDYATNKSKQSIKKLVNNMPLYAHVVSSDNSIKDENPKDLPLNTILEIRPGEKIAVDGIIVKGRCSLDLSSINGESLPKEATVNDKVYSGSINLDSVIQIRTTKLYKDSTLTKVMDLVENEQAKKAKSEKFITRFSKVYTPLIMVIALIVFLTGYGLAGFYWNGTNGGEQWLYKSLSILLVACPCALVVSIPITFFSGIGVGSKSGILMKGSNSLETIAKSTNFVFDKTGTLTKGNYVLKNNPQTKNLQLAASLESKSTHPLGKALITANKLPLLEVSDFRNQVGKGIEGTISGNAYLIGTKEFLLEEGIKDIPDIDSPYKVLYLGLKNQKALDYFIVYDEIKESSEPAFADLKKEKAKNNIILSGDDKKIVEEVANKVKADVAYGNLLPDEKLNYVKQYASQATLCYVGDGINDSPAILSADVGVAMGALGSDAAIEASDIVIMDDDLRKVPEAKRLARFTMKVLYEGLVLALGLKVLVMILVSLGLLGQYAMMIASLADTGVTALCILNAMQVLLYKPKYLPKKEKHI
jgi:Cd2+/Zn2+-exporting ATPase